MLIDDYKNLERQDVLELAQGIHGAAERLSRLIQNFLLYADLEITARDRERLSTLRGGETCFPNRLITAMATAIAQREGRKTDLKLELQDATIQISEPKLKIVVEELIDNAFKFSTAGTPVQIVAESTNNGLTLTILDHGRGMTQEQIDSLGAYMQFERKFYEQQGSGLGFAIAKRLVDLHGGTLTIASVPGQQTLVEATFPGVES